MSHHAPGQLYDLREWLLDRIDGSIETRGDDGLISDFIRQIDAATAELADLKQRLLPQFQGRAQRAEHERDGMLEQLIVHRTTIANLHSEIDGMRNAAPSATGAPPEEIDELGKYDDKPCGEGITLQRQWWSGGTWLEKGDRVVVLRPRMKGQPDRPDWARQLPGAELYDRDHGYDRTGSLNEGRYVCTCGACMSATIREGSDGD
jgi:hypothetical protein